MLLPERIDYYQVISPDIKDRLAGELQSSITFLDQRINKGAQFPNGPWVGMYSTASLNKRLLAIQSIRNGVVSILPPGETYSWFQPPEYAPVSGMINTPEKINASLIDNYFPESRNFASLPLERQAVIQALIKALQDFNVDPQNHPYVWATDVRANAGNYPLDKQTDPHKQKEALMKIADIGVIDGAVGVAVGKITDPTSVFPGSHRWKERDHFTTGSQLVRVHVAPISEKEIENYIAASQPEIVRSGWVINILSPTLQTNGWFTKYELQGLDGEFREVNFATASKVIAGYPEELLLKLLQDLYPNGNYPSGKELIYQLTYAKQNLAIIYYYLTGRFPK